MTEALQHSRLILTSSANLIVEGAAGTDKDQMCSLFAAGTEQGLLTLGFGGPMQSSSDELFYWRQFARKFIAAACYHSAAGNSIEETISPPEEAELQQFIMAAPPMKGGENLSVGILRDLWSRVELRLKEQYHKEAPDGLSLSAYVGKRDPAWRDVGRVVFHIAENKNDADRPFAFLATYISQVSSHGRAQHLPLGKAMEEYSGAKSRSALLSLLKPIQSATERSTLLQKLFENGQLYQAQKWGPRETYNFLKESPIFEASGIQIKLPNWWQEKTQRVKVKVTVGEKTLGFLGADALLDFSVGLSLGDEVIGEEVLEEILSQDTGLVRIKGRWVEADGEKLRQLLEHWRKVQRQTKSEGISFSEGMRLLAQANITGQRAETPGEISAASNWSTVDAGQWLEATLHTLKNPGNLRNIEMPTGLRADLRHYQKAGAQWLCFLKALGLGGCLADDMGLGKTLQILTMLLREQESRGKSAQLNPGLLVVPASLIVNWRNEATRFTPTLRLFVAHHSEITSKLWEKIAADENFFPAEVDLVITTYSVVHRLPWLRKINWDVIVLDEAQAIKNPAARQTKAVKLFRGKSRFALSGTPVENNVGELWSLFDFLNPGLLGGVTDFNRFVRNLQAEKDRGYAPLRRLIQPYILRRMKTDKNILADLPDKTEVLAYCSLTAMQISLYQEGIRDLGFALQNTDGINRKGVVLSFLQRFKQICNHPVQWLGTGSYLPKESAKFGRLQEIADEIHARHEKLLVFTQYREITEPLAEFLQQVFQRPGLVLSGDTAVAKRQALVDEFQREDGPQFFVLSLKAGGTGLNLTAASHVIHFDRWWNPAVENQATDRAYRIGQKKNVLVHKFVCRGTIEERIDSLLTSKRLLADELIGAEGAEKILIEMSNEELLQFVALDINSARSDENISQDR